MAWGYASQKPEHGMPWEPGQITICIFVNSPEPISDFGSRVQRQIHTMPTTYGDVAEMPAEEAREFWAKIRERMRALGVEQAKPS